MKIIKFILAISACLTAASCASIAGDNTRQVKVESNPPGAEIYVDNQQYGVTPAVISLPNYIYSGKSVTVKKRGFESQTQMVNSKFQPIALLDILFWPTFLIDIATGDIVKVDPAKLNLNYNLHRA